MKRVLRAFLGLAMCLGLASAVALAAPGRASRTPAPAPQAPYTVADFAVDLLAAMGQTGQTADSAVATLRGAGVRIANPQAALTEGEVVGLMDQLGISVRTGSPEKIVNEARAGQITSAFQTELSRNGRVNDGCVGCDEGAGSNPNDDFNNGNGRGGKFKRKKKNSQTGSD